VSPSGELQYCGDDNKAVVSDLSPEEFAEGTLMQGAKCVRILGTRDNAALIRAVYTKRKKDIPSQSVLIGGPRIGLRQENDKEDAAAIFLRMRAATMPSSVGGWRHLTRYDFVIYSMLLELQKSGGEVTKSVDLYLRQHPAWPALSFIYEAQYEPACLLVSEIVDPRWHVDPEEPDRFAQLRYFLGFGHTITEAAKNISSALSLLRGFAGTCPPCEDPRRRRAMLTVASWFGSFVESSKLSKSLEEHLEPPRSFLLRYLYRSNESEDYDTRFVRANHRFVRFVRSVWLDNLYMDRQYETVTQELGRRDPSRVSRHKMLCPSGYARTLFVPEHFFKTPDEVAAWKDHIVDLGKSHSQRH
jgi:hypothetical protein